MGAFTCGALDDTPLTDGEDKITLHMKLCCSISGGNDNGWAGRLEKESSRSTQHELRERKRGGTPLSYGLQTHHYAPLAKWLQGVRSGSKKDRQDVGSKV